MALAYALLSLKLDGSELFSDKLHISDSCERHLLLNVMAEPTTTNDVAEYVGNLVTKDHSAIDHRLEGEPLAKGKRHAPIGADLVQTHLSVKTQEIICHVGILCLEAGAASWENPIVLTIIVCPGTIAEIVPVIKYQCRTFLSRHQYVTIFYKIPAYSHLQVEVLDIEIERQQLCLMLMVEDAVVVVTVDIYVHIVPAEGIGESRTGETERMEGDVALYHHAFAQSKRYVGVNGR